MMMTTTDLRRNSDGTPMDGMDIVPERRVSCPLREQLMSVMSLLQVANDRNVQLLQSLSHWKQDYALLRAELLALKYDRLCFACQLQRLSTRDGECFEVACSKCGANQSRLTKLREEAEDKARYWQWCYESLLPVHYGDGDDDGTDVGLQ